MQADCGIDERLYVIRFERISQDPFFLLVGEGFELLATQVFFKIDMKALRVLSAPYEGGPYTFAIKAKEFWVLLKYIP